MAKAGAEAVANAPRVAKAGANGGGRLSELEVVGEWAVKAGGRW